MKKKERGKRRLCKKEWTKDEMPLAERRLRIDSEMIPVKDVEVGDDLEGRIVRVIRKEGSYIWIEFEDGGLWRYCETKFVMRKIK